MKIIFHPEAYDEMLESARFFEVKSPGLGFDLLNAIHGATDRLRRFPESGSIEEANIRKVWSMGFPSRFFMR